MKRRARGRRPPYLNSALSVEARVRDLLARMTIEEKVKQMCMRRTGTLVKNGRITGKAVRDTFGTMSIGCLEDLRKNPKTNVEVVNFIQKYLVERTRLGIPALVISECLHGHVSVGATVFPQAIGLASTWNVGLVRRMGEIVAKEASAVGVRQSLSPVLDLAREPRWGRTEETYGEDPYLASRMGVAYIKGMQGPGPALEPGHVFCTMKHFAAHGSPEAGVNISPVAGGMRDLRTVYLPPFEAAVKEADVMSVMPCYSEYDGIPASASKLLLTRVLREEWGFQGYTFSDYGAIGMLYTIHKTAHTPEEAGKQALEAGMDLEAPEDFGFGDRLLGLVKKGEVSTDLVDQAVARVLRAKFLAGLFENPYVDARLAARIVNAPEHRRLAREIAQESITLLRNEGNLLPLSRNLRRIAVIGPNADATQFGDYSWEDAKSDTPLEGIRRAAKGTKVLYSQGCGLCGTSHEGFKEAVEAASSSDVAIVVIGGTSRGLRWDTKMRPWTCGEGFDRSELTPPGVQEDLVRAVHATGTPTVVVLVHGRPYAISWMSEHIPAIVEAWYPGEEGGNALADVLFGKVNPSGKLPVSVPRSVGHLPAFYNHKPSARGVYKKPGTPDEPGRDYVFSDTSPLFRFGHGLSYTTFRYSNLRVSPGKTLPGGRVKVSVDVRNAGKRKGKEVVQLYLNDVFSSVTTPVKALRGFRKIELKPGEKATVNFELTHEDLKLLDENMNWVVEPGEFEVMIASLKKTFEVVRC